MNCVHEKQVKELYQMVQMLATMVEDLGHNVDSIYKELDMAEDEEELQWFDLCGCDNHAGHMCEESRQRYGRV